MSEPVRLIEERRFDPLRTVESSGMGAGRRVFERYRHLLTRAWSEITAAAFSGR